MLVQKICAATSAELLVCWFHIYRLKLFLCRIHRWGGSSSPPSQHVCIRGVSFLPSVHSVDGLTAWFVIWLYLVFKELRRKNVISYLTAKCINNALPSCVWASSVNAYSKLCSKFSRAVLICFSMSRHSLGSCKVLRLMLCCLDCWCAAFVVLFYLLAWRHHIASSDILRYNPCSTEKTIDLL